MNDAGLIAARARDAASRFPWYAELLRGPGGAGGPSAPPLLTASLLESRYYLAPPPAGAPPLQVYRTSGTSSGVRKAIYYSEEDDRRYVDIRTAIIGRWLAGSGVRTALADMGTGHAASTALDVFRRLGLTGEAISFELPVSHHLSKLRELRPELLYTMPSILERIAQASDDPSAYGIRRIWLVGEVASPAWQRGMAARFGIGAEDVLDTVGSIEIGTVAAWSHAHGRYVLADGLVAEGVRAEELDEGFEPLPPEERVLVLTSAVRDWFPAVRYVTYDVVRGLSRMRIGGRTVQTFDALVKRIGRELKHGEKISLYDIENAVCGLVPDADVRVAVTDRTLAVTIASRTLAPDRLPAVRRALEHRIPEIGRMIEGGLLSGIDIRCTAAHAPVKPGTVKSKKIAQ